MISFILFFLFFYLQVLEDVKTFAFCVLLFDFLCALICFYVLLLAFYVLLFALICSYLLFMYSYLIYLCLSVLTNVMLACIYVIVGLRASCSSYYLINVYIFAPTLNEIYFYFTFITRISNKMCPLSTFLEFNIFAWEQSISSHLQSQFIIQIGLVLFYGV